MIIPIFNFFKKKKDLAGLAEALRLGLITEEERWRLEAERADEKLKDFLDKQKKRR